MLPLLQSLCVTHGVNVGGDAHTHIHVFKCLSPLRGLLIASTFSYPSSSDVVRVNNNNTADSRGVAGSRDIV